MDVIIDIFLSAGFREADVLASYAMIHASVVGRHQVVLHDDEYSRNTDGLEEPLARLAPLLDGLRGRDFSGCGIDTIIAGLGTRRAAFKNDSQPGTALPTGCLRLGALHI